MAPRSSSSVLSGSGENVGGAAGAEQGTRLGPVARHYACSLVPALVRKGTLSAKSISDSGMYMLHQHRHKKMI